MWRSATQTTGQTDMTKLIVAFCNFAKAPKVGYVRAYTHASPPPPSPKIHIFFVNELLYSSLTGEPSVAVV